MFAGFIKEGGKWEPGKERGLQWLRTAFTGSQKSYSDLCLGTVRMQILSTAQIRKKVNPPWNLQKGMQLAGTLIFGLLRPVLVFCPKEM